MRGWHCKDNKDSVHIEVLERVFKSSVYKSQEVRIDFWYLSFLDRLKFTLKCICIFPCASAPPLCFQFIRRQKAEMSICEKVFFYKTRTKKEKSFVKTDVLSLTQFLWLQNSLYLLYQTNINCESLKIRVLD